VCVSCDNVKNDCFIQQHSNLMLVINAECALCERETEFLYEILINL